MQIFSYEFFEYILVVLALIVSSCYSAFETALVSISQIQSKQIIEQGGTRGELMSFWLSHSNQILTTILIGNTLMNTFIAGVLSNITNRILGEEALAISVILSTFLVLVFGEIIPKMLGRVHAHKIYYIALLVLRFNYYLFYPIVAFLYFLVKTILGKSGEMRNRPVTKDDIKFMVTEAERIKTIDSKQIDLLSSILEFPSIKVKDIMVPRNKVNYLRKGQHFLEVVRSLRKYGHSRYPVCETDLDSSIGFLHVKDIAFINILSRKEFDIENFLKPPFFVYEHMKIQMVFDYMNRKKVHLALVKNENGMVVGIVTLEDIVEEILGEIVDEHDVESEEKGTSAELSKGVVVSGETSLRDLYSEFDIKIPLNDNYSTLSGFILDHIGNHFPKKGMLIFWENLCFKLDRVDNNEIKKILITDIEGEKHLFSRKLVEHTSMLKSSNNSDDPLD